MKIRTTPIKKTVTTKDLRKIMPTLFQLQRDSEERGVEIGSTITAKKRFFGKGNKLRVRSGLFFNKPFVGDAGAVFVEGGDAEVGEFHTHVKDLSGEMFWGTEADAPVLSTLDFCGTVDTNIDSIECVAGFLDCEKHTKKCPVINCYRLRKTKKDDLPKLTRDVYKKVCRKDDTSVNDSFYYDNANKLWRKILSETRGRKLIRLRKH